MTTDTQMIDAIHFVPSTGSEQGCGQVDPHRWDQLWSLLALAVDDEDEPTAILHRMSQDDDEETVSLGIPAALLPGVPAAWTSTAVRDAETQPEGSERPGFTPTMLTVPAQQQPQPDAAGKITPGGLPVDVQGANEPGWIDTESKPVPSSVNPAPQKSSVAHAPGTEARSEHTVEAEATVPNGRWVSLSPRAAGRTAGPTAKQPIPGEQRVGDAPMLQNTEARDPRTPRPPERIEPPVSNSGEAEVTVPDGRWVSLSRQAAGRTAGPTAKQPIPGEQGVGDAPMLQDAEAPDPRTPRTPERIEPPVSNSGEAVAEAGTAARNAPEIPSAVGDESETVSGEGSRPGSPLRETISRSPESVVHLRVRDEAVSTVDIRLRTHGGNLIGRLHTGDDALMKDLSAGLDSLRRHLGELGYGDVDLNLGTDGRQHRDMYRRNDPRSLAFREVTRPTFTSRPHRTQGHERSLVDVLA